MGSPDTSRQLFSIKVQRMERPVVRFDLISLVTLYMLVQRSSQGDIESLCSPADPQKWSQCLSRNQRHEHGPPIEERIRRDGSRMGKLPIETRIDIALTASKKQAIEGENGL